MPSRHSKRRPVRLPAYQVTRFKQAHLSSVKAELEPSRLEPTGVHLSPSISSAWVPPLMSRLALPSVIAFVPGNIPFAGEMPTRLRWQLTRQNPNKAPSGRW
ncbi:uncharacterized protein UDID_19314 [Ustilago sp. UG-2017a]|nr:uncharacterized protein UDID_19314 [Ustilago sp. UG-2017a]